MISDNSPPGYPAGLTDRENAAAVRGISSVLRMVARLVSLARGLFF
jgi:hypothetical protein